MFLRSCEKSTQQVLNLSKPLTNLFLYRKCRTAANENEEFLPLQLYKKAERAPPKRMDKNIRPERADTMPVDQDWPSVWPVARTFHPASVPLPIRQGIRAGRKAVPPGKHANAELMKIPNFLHLTPPAIKRHCNAIKRFCTDWPAGLETDEQCEKHFPVEIITSDYVYSSPTIREPLARIVSLKVHYRALHLSIHARDKLLRLVGNRYDPDTEVITITADRCPTRKQNLDYVKYLLTAVYHESWHKADWEDEKSVVDMELFEWDSSDNRKRLMAWHKWPKEPEEIDYKTIPYVSQYKDAVSDLINTGEDHHTINKYKQAVKNVLSLK